MNEDNKEYINMFKSDKLKEALDIALDIRKFEIDLYWKRTTYFWTLTAATITGYILALTKFDGTQDDKSIVLILLSCLGFVFSVAWFAVNKGSKFWAENWEAHIDMLEDEVIGHLYKTNMINKDNDKNFITSSKKYSVSSINQVISFFVSIIFLILVIKSIFPVSCNLQPNFYKISIISVTALITLLIIANGDHKKMHLLGRWNSSNKDRNFTPLLRRSSSDKVRQLDKTARSV